MNTKHLKRASIALLAIAATYGIRTFNAINTLQEETNKLLPEIHEEIQESFNVEFDIPEAKAKYQFNNHPHAVFNPFMHSIKIYRAIIPAKGFIDLALGNYMNADYSLHDVLRHELGHALTYQRFSELEMDFRNLSVYKHYDSFEYWKKTGNKSSELEAILMENLVIEGIAQYIEGVTPKEYDWPDLDELRDWDLMFDFFYTAGLNFVKPILDEKFNEGMNYLLTNLPQRYDNAIEYQEEALRVLSK